MVPTSISCNMWNFLTKNNPDNHLLLLLVLVVLNNGSTKHCTSSLCNFDTGLIVCVCVCVCSFFCYSNVVASSKIHFIFNLSFKSQFTVRLPTFFFVFTQSTHEKKFFSLFLVYSFFFSSKLQILWSFFFYRNFICEFPLCLAKNFPFPLSDTQKQREKKSFRLFFLCF